MQMKYDHISTHSHIKKRNIIISQFAVVVFVVYLYCFNKSSSELEILPTTRSNNGEYICAYTCWHGMKPDVMKLLQLF